MRWRRGTDDWTATYTPPEHNQTLRFKQPQRFPDGRPPNSVLVGHCLFGRQEASWGEVTFRDIASDITGEAGG